MKKYLINHYHTDSGELFTRVIETDTIWKIVEEYVKEFDPDFSDYWLGELKANNDPYSHITEEGGHLGDAEGYFEVNIELFKEIPVEKL